MRELDAIDVSQPLPDRLAEAAEALQAHMDRLGAIIGSLGHGGGKHPGTVRGAGRDESTTRTRAALTELLEPDKAALRRPPEQIAALFIGLLFTQPRTEDGPDLTSQELVEVFLHGALSGAPSERAEKAPEGYGPGRPGPSPGVAGRGPTAEAPAADRRR